jgi:hypothetical protein
MRSSFKWTCPPDVALDRCGFGLPPQDLVPGAAKGILHTYVRVVGGDWRDGFEYAWQASDPETRRRPGLTWRQLTPRHWSGSWNGKLHGTITAEADRWLAYVRLEDHPGLSPITAVGRFATVDEAQVATDEVCASR